MYQWHTSNLLERWSAKRENRVDDEEAEKEQDEDWTARWEKAGTSDGDNDYDF